MTGNTAVQTCYAKAHDYSYLAVRVIATNLATGASAPSAVALAKPLQLLLVLAVVSHLSTLLLQEPLTVAALGAASAWEEETTKRPQCSGEERGTPFYAIL